MFIVANTRRGLGRSRALHYEHSVAILHVRVWTFQMVSMNAEIHFWKVRIGVRMRVGQG